MVRSNAQLTYPFHLIMERHVVNMTKTTTTMTYINVARPVFLIRTVPASRIVV